MIDLDKNRLVKYPLFGSLYFSQGIIYAFATVLIPFYFVEIGVDVKFAGIVVGIAYIPWIVKFIFGGIVDYFIKFGRKYFIILGGILGGSGLIIASILDPKIALIPFTLFIFISSSGVAFLDVSADAWAIQITEEKERGKVNGAMFSGLFIGTAITASSLGIVANEYGFPITFIVGGFLIMLIMVFPLFVKEPIIIKSKQKVGKLLVQEFRKKNTQLVCMFGPIAHISFGLLGIVVPIYIASVLKLNPAHGSMIASLGIVATVIGNFVGGYITDKWDRKKSIFLFVGLNIVFAAMLIFANDWQKLAIIWGIVGFLHGCHYSAIGALLMDVTNPRLGASQYSIMTSFMNVGEMGGTAISGTLIAMLGFSRVFLYSGWVYGPALLVLYFVRLKQKKSDPIVDGSAKKVILE